MEVKRFMRYGAPKAPVRSLRAFATTVNMMLMSNLYPDTWIKVPVKRVNLVRSIAFISTWLGKLASSPSWGKGSYNPSVLANIIKSLCEIRGVDCNLLNIGSEPSWDHFLNVYVDLVKRRENETERKWIERVTLINIVILDMLASVALIDIFSSSDFVE